MVRMQTSRSMDELPREGHVVVMTHGRPPRTSALSYVQEAVPGKRCAYIRSPALM